MLNIYIVNFNVDIVKFKNFRLEIDKFDKLTNGKEIKATYENGRF